MYARKVAACLLVSLFSIGTAHSEVSIQEYKSMTDENLTKIYISGLGKGIFWANLDANSLLKKKLYCPPGKLALAVDNYMQILNDEIARGIYPADTPIEFVLLKGLERVFPC